MTDEMPTQIAWPFVGRVVPEMAPTGLWIYHTPSTGHAPLPPILGTVQTSKSSCSMTQGVHAIRTPQAPRPAPQANNCFSAQCLITLWARKIYGLLLAVPRI